MLPRRSLKLSVNPFKLLKQKVLPLAVGAIFIVLIYNLFVIRYVQCTLNTSPCPQNISDKLKTYIGASAIFIDQKNLSASIKSLYPVNEIRIGFHLFNTLEVSLVGDDVSYGTKVYLVSDLPIITMDEASGSTVSASWPKPTTEIDSYITQKDGLNFDLWNDGSMTPSATGEAKIIYIFKDKADQETLASIYKAIKTVSKYLDFEKLYILDHRIFLRQSNQPDIIVYVPFDEGSLVQALQSFAYLVTIKKDAKVVDLRFKNPIIR